MIRILFVCIMFFFSQIPLNTHAASVVPLTGDKIPKLPPGLTLTETYSAGPAPKLDVRASNRDILARLVPDGWTVKVEKSILSKKSVISANPTESWMAALERFISLPKYRAMVRPETKEVFVRVSSGGYPYQDVAPWVGSPANPMTWGIRGGEPLQKQLSNWCRLAGYTLFWEAPLDYKMRGSAAFDGTFEAAIQQLFDVLYYNGEMSLKATIYRGNHVIRVRQD